MTIFIALMLVALFVAALAVGGHLARIAEAIEAQNKAYGVGVDDEKKAA